MKMKRFMEEQIIACETCFGGTSIVSEVVP